MQGATLLRMSSQCNDRHDKISKPLFDINSIYVRYLRIRLGIIPPQQVYDKTIDISTESATETFFGEFFASTSLRW